MNPNMQPPQETPQVPRKSGLGLIVLVVLLVVAVAVGALLYKMTKIALEDSDVLATGVQTVADASELVAPDDLTAQTISSSVRPQTVISGTNLMNLLFAGMPTKLNVTLTNYTSAAVSNIEYEVRTMANGKTKEAWNKYQELKAANAGNTVGFTVAWRQYLTDNSTVFCSGTISSIASRSASKPQACNGTFPEEGDIALFALMNHPSGQLPGGAVPSVRVWNRVEGSRPNELVVAPFSNKLNPGESYGATIRIMNSGNAPITNATLVVKQRICTVIPVSTCTGSTLETVTEKTGINVGVNSTVNIPITGIKVNKYGEVVNVVPMLTVNNAVIFPTSTSTNPTQLTVGPTTIEVTTPRGWACPLEYRGTTRCP